MQLGTVRSPEPVGGKWLPPQAREPLQTIIPAGPKPRQGKTVEGRTQVASLLGLSEERIRRRSIPFCPLTTKATTLQALTTGSTVGPTQAVA